MQKHALNILIQSGQIGTSFRIESASRKSGATFDCKLSRYSVLASVKAGSGGESVIYFRREAFKTVSYPSNEPILSCKKLYYETK